MEVERTHALVMGWGMMLGDVVGHVFGPGGPENGKLALADAIAEPVETHVDGFGAALFNCVVEDAFGTFIVRLDGGGRLGVAELNEGLTDGTAVLAAEEGRTYFSFSRRGHDVAQDGAVDMDGGIERSGSVSRAGVRVVTEKEVATGTGFGAGDTEVEGITVDV